MSIRLGFIQRQSKSQINRKSRLLTEHEFIWGESGGVSPCAIVDVHQWFDVVLPVTFFLFSQGSKHLEQSSVEPLNRIPSGMIGSCPCFLDPSWPAKIFIGFRFKIWTLITIQTFKETIMHKEVILQAFGYSGGFLVGCRHSNGIPREMIGYNEDVLCAAIWLH